MRIALVQCPAWGVLPPLGIAGLKSLLESRGHGAPCYDLNLDFYKTYPKRKLKKCDPWGPENFSMWDLTFSPKGRPRFAKGSPWNRRKLPIKEWARLILADSPDAVGFSVCMTSVAASLMLAEKIREMRPGLPILMGGPSAARDQKGLMVLASGLVDAAVHGEGEQTLLDLVSAMEQGRDFAQVPGVGVLRDGKPVWLKKRRIIARLDSLPFSDFSDFDQTAYLRPYEIPIMAARGCVNKCAFCYECNFWPGFRLRSPENVVEEMERQVALHPLNQSDPGTGLRPYFHFAFADSLLNGNLKWMERFCDLLIQKKGNWRWAGQATVRPDMSDGLLNKIAQSGCDGLYFGLESASQRVLDAMGKTFQAAEAGPFFERVHAAGVPMSVNVMVGFPNETFRDFLETLMFLYRYRHCLNQVTNVTTTSAPPGTRLFKDPERYGMEMKINGRWTSKETGTEFHRKLRLRMLHFAVAHMGIAHQKMAK